MDAGERITGTRNEQYNLIAVIYHALHGAKNCEVYSTDAEAVGRNDQAAFFREARDIQRDLADRAKGLLGIGGGAPRAGGVTVSGATETGIQIPSQTGAPPDEAGVTTEELPPPTSASNAEPSSSGPARAGGGALRGDVPPRTAQSGETPPPGPRRAALADTEPFGEELALAEWEVVPPDAPRTEEPPPRTGDAPPSPSEQPPR